MGDLDHCCGYFQDVMGVAGQRGGQGGPEAGSSPILVLAVWERRAGLKLMEEEAVGEGTSSGAEEQPRNVTQEAGLHRGLGGWPVAQEVRQGRAPWLWPWRAIGEVALQ